LDFFRSETTQQFRKKALLVLSNAELTMQKANASENIAIQKLLLGLSFLLHFV